MANKDKRIALTLLLSVSIGISLAGCGTEQTDKAASVDTTNDVIVNKNIQETNQPKQESKTTNTSNTKNTTSPKNATNTLEKIQGREELLARLDNIQKELDALPEKKNSDAGVTNAMRSYYGRSYEMYDKALNEIYTLLKDQLPSETMKNLQTEQIKWIEQKKAAANQEASQYKGGTFEFVAHYVSLYESTKQRCYELVNLYMLFD